MKIFKAFKEVISFYKNSDPQNFAGKKKSRFPRKVGKIDILIPNSFY